MITDNIYLNRLSVMAGRYNAEVHDIANFLLEDSRFPLWSGSSKPNQHHYGYGGLVKHTYEVVTLCKRVHDLIGMDDGTIYGIEQGILNGADKIDETVLFLGALFHDAGKMSAYEPCPNDPTHPTTHPNNYRLWNTTDYARLIYHIPGSAVAWTEACGFAEVKNHVLHDKVLHVILSHHAQRQYGSPVAPKTREAWLVHFCDGISARMNDADTWDILKRD